MPLYMCRITIILYKFKLVLSIKKYLMIGQEDQEDIIDLKIPTVRDKLLTSFPNDLRSDIKIVFKSKIFLLAKAHLRLQSGYFNQKLSPTVNFLQIKQNFNQQNFQQVMSCFYGATIKMPRTQLADFYPIIKFLEIQYLLNFIKNDILTNIAQYDLFVVMKIAHAYLQQKIFEVCLEELQKQSFEQLKYHQFQFLQLDLPLFKLIIKTHGNHRMNKKTGVPYLQINKLIHDYCDNRNMSQEEYMALKYELINQNSLTANQYKEIFLNQIKKFQSKPIGMSQMPEYPTNQSIIVNGNNGLTATRLETNKLAQSIIGTGNGMSKIIDQPMVAQNPTNISVGLSIGNSLQGSANNYGALQMQNFFHKKQNQELKVQNMQLAESLKNLRQMTEENQKIHEKMERQLNILKEQLKKKQMLEVQHKRKITKLENGMTLMQKQLQKKTENINQLADMIQELKKRRPVSDQQEQDNNYIVQSQFLPAHLIQQMMTSAEPPQAKNAVSVSKKAQASTNEIDYQSLDQQELEQLYLPRIEFDVEPVSTPKYNLPKLCLLITSDGFNKYALNLIYRRSASAPAKGNNTDILGRKNLLILIQTDSKQNIGGFVSVPIDKSKECYTEDPGAFLFSLTKNQKFYVKKADAQEAIFMSDQYLICFANDLWIKSDCLKERSECSWPSSYEGIKGLKQKGSVWFAGQSNFLIKHIDVYEMGEKEMEMVL